MSHRGSQTSWKKPRQKFIVEQENPQNQNKIIQEGIVASEDDSYLPRRNHKEERDAPPSRQEHGEDQHKLKRQRQGCRGRVEAVRQVMRVPGDPCGQRSILIILIHGREISPFRVASQDFRDPRFKINAEHQPNQKKPAGARGSIRIPPARPPSGGRKKQTDETRFEQHAVGLIAREILRSGDKGQKRNHADDQCPPGAQVQDQKHRHDHSDDANRKENAVACRPPKYRRRKPEAPRSQETRNFRQVVLSGKDPTWSDESANLKDQRIEGREKYQSQSAQEQPSRGQIAGVRCVRAEQTFRYGAEVDVHRRPLYTVRQPDILKAHLMHPKIALQT